MIIIEKTLRTKVLHSNRTFLIPALKLGLMQNSSLSGFSHDIIRLARISILLFLTVFFYACAPSPEPINYGKDECEHCRMMITDNKYGAEVVSDKGKIYKFDSIECLIEYALEKNMVGNASQSFLVTDFSKPEDLINAKTAFYVHNDNFRSPMGLNISAFGSESELTSFITANGGKILSWVDIIELVKQNIM
jgi:copper chaperone NosL